MDPKMVQRGGFLAWNIWFERNNFIFENKSVPLEVWAQRVYRQVEEHNTYTQRIYVGSKNQHISSPSKCCAPSGKLVKVNTDASLSEEGWVCNRLVFKSVH